jgi:hypothetical protein
MRQPGEHDMLDALHLRRNGRLDDGLVVAEQIHPPGTHRIQNAPALRVDQPYALAAHDFQRRRALVPLHLRAGMPHGAQAAGGEGGGCWHWQGHGLDVRLGSPS